MKHCLKPKKEVEILLIIYVISLSLEEVVCLKFSLLNTLVVSTLYYHKLYFFVYLPSLSYETLTQEEDVEEKELKLSLVHFSFL